MAIIRLAISGERDAPRLAGWCDTPISGNPLSGYRGLKFHYLAGARAAWWLPVKKLFGWLDVLPGPVIGKFSQQPFARDSPFDVEAGILCDFDKSTIL